jgi:hypothetical protein
VDQTFDVALYNSFKLGPDSLKKWLDDVDSGLITPPDNLHWHGLADGAFHYSGLARKSGSATLAWEWARLATRIYDRLMLRAAKKTKAPQKNKKI